MSVLMVRLPVGSLVGEYCMDLEMMQLAGPVVNCKALGLVQLFPVVVVVVVLETGKTQRVLVVLVLLMMLVVLVVLVVDSNWLV